MPILVVLFSKTDDASSNQSTSDHSMFSVLAMRGDSVKDSDLLLDSVCFFDLPQ